MKNMAFTMRTVPKSRRKRVTGFRNRNTDKWVDGNKISSRYGVGWGIKGGWSGEDRNPNYSSHVQGYQEYNDAVNEDEDLNNTEREQAAQAIADFQNLTDAQVNHFLCLFIVLRSSLVPTTKLGVHLEL